MKDYCLSCFRAFGRLFLWRALPVMLLAVLAAPPVAFADDDEDWQRLHREVAAGRVKSLVDILERLAENWVGEVIDVDIDDDDGVLVYEIDLLGPDGQVAEFEIDARTGEVLEVEGRNLRAMER